MIEPHTHPVPKTITRAQAGADVLELAERLCPLPLSNESLWYILRDALDVAYAKGFADGTTAKDPDQYGTDVLADLLDEYR
jgi:hypothetical protein